MVQGSDVPRRASADHCGLTHRIDPRQSIPVPTANPTPVTIACESADYRWDEGLLTEACGWNEVPRYLIRDRDGAYGETLIRRLEAMGIRDRPSSARSPWQNGHAERLIGSIRRDCLDHVVVFGERHLRHLLNSYQRYYNEVRTHLSLQKDAPIPRAVRSAGRIVPVPLLGGLHHQYVRV